MVGSTAVECNFAIVQMVTIESVDGRNVTFKTRSAGNGNPDQSLRLSFTVPLTEIYTLPITGAPPAVAMYAGATGNLYLSRQGWAATAMTPDGARVGIYGLATAVFKWPICGAIATPPLTRLSVIPTSIIVRGHLPGESTFFDIELAGPDAGDAQDIVLNGVDYIAVQLTPRGARRMGLPAHAQTIELWPTRLRIKGSPAIDQAVLGEVDVLDAELAACTQRIEYGRRGAPVTLVLTQDGINAFHVTPQAVAEAQCGPEPASALGPSEPGGPGERHSVQLSRRGAPE
jgi:hypothetical protein